jgi:hypothetical protein
VNLNDGIKSIEYRAFWGCYDLENITLPDSVVSIGAQAFCFCPFTTIVIPDSVTTISESAFGQCKKLKTVSIGVGVTTIEERAFQSSEGIEIRDEM